jgi:hypothetical protein
VPAFRHNPAASRPDCAGAGARTGGLMWTMHHGWNEAMSKIKSAEQDPNAELRSFEPLRVTLALGALLLGLLLGL